MAVPFQYYVFFARLRRYGFCRNAHQQRTLLYRYIPQRENLAHRTESSLRRRMPCQKAEEALQQIIDENYASPYPDAVCVGMAIDDTKRQITDVKTVRP